MFNVLMLVPDFGSTDEGYFNGLILAHCASLSISSRRRSGRRDAFFAVAGLQHSLASIRQAWYSADGETAALYLRSAAALQTNFGRNL
jgi:hypothetical protein